MENHNTIASHTINSSYQRVSFDSNQIETLISAAESTDSTDIDIAKSFFKLVDYRRLHPNSISLLKKWLRSIPYEKEGLAWTRGIRNKIWNLYGV